MLTQRDVCTAVNVQCMAVQPEARSFCYFSFFSVNAAGG